MAVFTVFFIKEISEDLNLFFFTSLKRKWTSNFGSKKQPQLVTF